ncbi:21.7 kDa class VI heat shock protein isoform X3 [Cucumis sativus]|uniref:21.7 kDa class VI heat shock protein isoform X3 n=1 Tax=Cucumis sativus TaxID=3659 RepID=UPI0005ED08BF|nr:21.7 kDa class VI heat shock protein isoform X3 [Cucumis sativus]
MATSKQLEVHKEDHPTPSKWSVSLGEEVFRRFLGQANSAIQKVFGDGSLFSPLLFGKFFDPADAFPLWEFESDLLLSNLRISGKSSIDWSQTDQEYVLQAELLVKGDVRRSLPLWTFKNKRRCTARGAFERFEVERMIKRIEFNAELCVSQQHYILKELPKGPSFNSLLLLRTHTKKKKKVG